MPHFSYTALDSKGRKRRGTIAATEELDAENRIQRMGLIPLEIKQKRDRNLWFYRRRVSMSHLAHLYDRLADSLGVGLPITTVLEENARITGNRYLRSILEQLRLYIEEGNMLSEAMEHYPSVFDRLQRAVVRMGETTGKLPDALRQLADFLFWQAEQKSLIRRALIYPVFIIISLLAVMGIWFGYVLPQVGNFLVSVQISLPLITRTVLRVGNFLQDNWLSLFLSFSGVAIFLILGGKTKVGRLWIDKLLLYIPLLGSVIRNTSYCRLSTNFSMMLEAGMTIGTIFDILCSGVIGNRFLERDLASIYQRVMAGATLYEAFSSSSEYPELFLSAIRSGEMNGTLGETLAKLGSYYDKEVNRTMKAFTASFEPASLVLLGGAFGLVALAILLPLYNAFSGFQSF